METLQAKIDRLETELAEINENETFTQDLIDRKNQVTNDLSEARHNLNLQQAFEQAQQVREQKQTEQLDSLGQQIQDMNLVGMILPENQLAGTGISLTEYGELRQKLNQLLHTWATEIQQATYTAHNAEVDTYQAQIRELKDELRTTEADRDNAIQNGKDVAARLTEANGENIVLAQQREEARQKANQAFKEIDALEEKVNDLMDQLDNAKKPTLAIQTSASVQEQLEGLRKKSAESWTDKANRGLARFDLPPIGAPDLPPMEVAQPGNTFPTSESTGDQLPATEESVGERFQAGEQSDGLSVEGNRDMAEVVGETIEERVATLEGKMNMVSDTLAVLAQRTGGPFTEDEMKWGA